jgi:hypothetical protein
LFEEKRKGLFKRELSPALAKKLEEALAARSERGLLNLSEVQIACLRLWESDDPDALFEAAGVEGLLSGYLEEALDTLPPRLRDPAILVLTRLVTGAGTRNVVSEEDLSEKRREDDPPREVLVEGVKALETTALLRREVRHDIHFYEISSEFLVPWIRRKRLERQARLERAAIENAERGKRRRAYLASAVAALVILIASLAYYLTLKREVLAETWVRQATDAADRAVRARDDALERARRFERQAETASADRNRALEQARQANSAATAAVASREGALAQARQAVQQAATSDAAARAALAARDAALDSARRAGAVAIAAAADRDEAMGRATRAEAAVAAATTQRNEALREARQADAALQEARGEFAREREELTDSITNLQRSLRAATASRDALRDSTRSLTGRIQQMSRDTSRNR